MVYMVRKTVREDSGRGRERVRRISPYHWKLWAIAQANQFPHLGYPTQAPFYQPARLSKVEVVDDDRKPPDIDDWRLVERVEAAVALHRSRKPREVWMLEVCEGAFEGAGTTIRERCCQMGVKMETCKQMASRARRAIDALLDGVNHSG